MLFKYKYLVVIIVGLLAGVWLASLLPVGALTELFSSLFGLVLLAVYFLSRSERKSFFLIIALSLLALSVGIWRFNFSSATTREAVLPTTAVTLVGQVAEAPKVGETTTQLIFQPENHDFKILLFVGRFSSLKYGDKIEVIGKAILPKDFALPTGNIFAYRDYLAKDDVAYLIFQPKITLLAGGEGSWLLSRLYDLKNNFLGNLSQSLPEPEASLAGGVVIGGSGNLGQKLEDDFRTTGLSHVIVLSGYNITIVAEYIMRAFSFLPRLAGVASGALGIILFAIMAGGGSTVLRACLMALFALVARATGRLYDVTIALLVAGAGMVLLNPKILVFDIGFQLSFLATLGLIFAEPFFRSKLFFIPTWFGLRETASGTFGAQLLVMPWIFYKMGQLSLIGFISNILVLPIVPTAMTFSFLTGGVGFISHFLALPFAILDLAILRYIITAVKFFASLPLASVSLAQVPLFLTLAIYGLIAWMLRRDSLKNPKYEPNINIAQVLRQ